MDVINGDGPAPSLVVPLLLGLPDTSMYHAMKRGGIEFLGWGADREIAAGSFDALQLNTKATGNWKKKPPELPLWPRPEGKAKKKKTSLASIQAKLRG